MNEPMGIGGLNKGCFVSEDRKRNEVGGKESRREKGRRPWKGSYQWALTGTELENLHHNISEDCNLNMRIKAISISCKRKCTVVLT